MEMSALEMTFQNHKILSTSMHIINAKEGSFNLIYLTSLFFMWLAMMVAMMLPSAIPVIMLFDKISNERKKLHYKYVPTINFTLSYIFAWSFFCLVATAIHYFFEVFNILNPVSLKVGSLIGGLLFIIAGIYQMTPLKEACLRYCRNPIEILGGKKIFNNLDAFYVGLKHGIFCIGCCWILMLLLFYVGIMNILWIAGLSIYILVEKYLLKAKKT